MKPDIVCWVAAPVLAAALFVMPGCGGDTAAKQYSRIVRERGSVIKNSATANEKDFQETVSALRDIVRRHQDWENAAEIQFSIAGMYADRREYNAAREEFAKVYTTFPGRGELCARAQFLAGTLYEKEGNWSGALREFSEVLNRYGATLSGLRLPLYIAEHYRRNGMPGETNNAYERAVHHYLNIIERNPDGENIAVIAHLLQNAYSGLERWEEAVRAFEKIAGKYPRSAAAPLVLYRAAAIYRDVLKQPDRALSALQLIIKDYPQSDTIRDALFDAGNLAFARGDLAQGRSLFGAIMERFKGEDGVCAKAQLSLALGWENAGRWDAALEEFKKLEINYPDTIEAARVHVLIARHYRNENKSLEAGKALENAVKSCARLVAGNGGDATVIEAHELMSSVYCLQKEWEKGITPLRIIRKNYPASPRAAPALFRIAMIYREGLNDAPRSRAAFRMFIREYPNHPLAATARRMLDTLPQ